MNESARFSTSAADSSVCGLYSAMPAANDTLSACTGSLCSCRERNLSYYSVIRVFLELIRVLFFVYLLMSLLTGCGRLSAIKHR